MGKNVVFDFDGVIHSYESGWGGITCIPDPPVPGIKEAIQSIRDYGYRVYVVSSRCITSEGIEAVQEWLREQEIYVDGVCADKPPAVVYIDDRAICFDGDAKSLLKKIRTFIPWYEDTPEEETEDEVSSDSSTNSHEYFRECIHNEFKILSNLAEESNKCTSLQKKSECFVLIDKMIQGIDQTIKSYKDYIELLKRDSDFHNEL